MKCTLTFFVDSEMFGWRVRQKDEMSLEALEERVDTATKKVETAIRMKLVKKLDPVYLDVINDSETHFKVIIVSEMFNGKSLVEVSWFIIPY